MRKTMIAILFLLGGSVIYAQDVVPIVTLEESNDKHKVETNHFWDNWFISAGAGAQMYFGDHNRQMSVGKQLSPSLDFSVGKWFTPTIGVRMVYSGLSVKGLTQNGTHSTGEMFDASRNLSYQKFNLGHLHGDVMFNLTNMICGYKPTRLYSVTPYVGLGMMFAYDQPRTREFSANLGIVNSFRLSSVLDLNVDVRGSMVNDRFDGEVGGREFEGVLAANIGLTYKFKEFGWKRRGTKTVVHSSESELNELRERLNAMQQRLLDEAAEKKRLEEQSVAPLSIPREILVFHIGKSTLTTQSKVNLGFFAKVILANPTRKFLITGFADSYTGSAKINERLSRARAQAVYDFLVQEFNVPSSSLSTQSMGGVDNLFYNDPTLNRSAIIEVLP